MQIPHILEGEECERNQVVNNNNFLFYEEFIYKKSYIVLHQKNIIGVLYYKGRKNEFLSYK